MEWKFTFSKITKKIFGIFGYFFLRSRFWLSWCCLWRRICCLRCRRWLVYISWLRKEDRLNTVGGGWLFDYLKRRIINYWLVWWRWYQNNLTLARIFSLVDVTVVQLHNWSMNPWSLICLEIYSWRSLLQKSWRKSCVVGHERSLGFWLISGL